MRNIIFFLVVLPLLTTGQNHEVVKRKICGTDYIQGSIVTEMENMIESQTQEFIKNGGAKSLNFAAAGIVYTIPVVVHVVFKNKFEQISPDLIKFHLDRLNEDFQARNSDLNQVRSEWSQTIANCQIQFCLATIDPNSNITSGIVYKGTSVSSFTDLGESGDDVKRSINGGDDPWPTSQYLNIWICDLSPEDVYGYAWLPEQNKGTAVDGVVMDYFVFENQSPNDNRALTHEVGHWLNLRHLWGNNNSSLCVGSDKVADTPTQLTDNADDCPAFPHISCSDPNGDMYMNFMDYSNCRYFFTNGQKDRMWATLQPGGAHYFVTVSGKCNTLPLSSKIIAYEQWFDNNYLNKTVNSIIPIDYFDLKAKVPATSLPFGLHNFHIRFKDDMNNWSSLVSQFFFCIPGSGASKINRYEYWFDSKYGQRMSQNITPAVSAYSLNTNITTSALTNGSHALHIRFRQNNNLWSSVLSQTFIKTDAIIESTAILKIDSLEFNNNNSILIFPNPSQGKFFVVTNKQNLIRSMTIKNVYGQEVYRLINAGKSSAYEINLEGNTQGTYFVEVFDGKQEYVQKIVMAK